MRKTSRMLITLLLFVFAGCSSTYAGNWSEDINGSYYINDDGTYPCAMWKWIDGNGDGVAECYYFDANGYCLMNTITPDNCQVNGEGAWIVDGVVQTQAIPVSSGMLPEEVQYNPETESGSNAVRSVQSGSGAGTGSAAIPTEGIVYVSKTGSKYHKDASCGTMKDPLQMTVQEAGAGGRKPCSKCYRV